MPWSWVNTEYSIHQVQHHPKIDSVPLPASDSSLGRCGCSRLSIYPQLQVDQWVESPQPLCLPPCLPPADRQPPSTSPMLLNQSLQVHCQTRSIIASECITQYSQSRPPSASLNPLNHGLQVHLWVHSISALKCISKLAQSWPAIASLSSLNLGLQLHLQTRSIKASKYSFIQRQQVYSDTGVMEMDWVTGSICSGDSGVDRHHIMFISSYHTTKIHTPSFPSFALTHYFWDFMDPCNYVDPRGRVVSYLLTIFLHSSS